MDIWIAVHVYHTLEYSQYWIVLRNSSHLEWALRLGLLLRGCVRAKLTMHSWHGMVRLCLSICHEVWIGKFLRIVQEV